MTFRIRAGVPYATVLTHSERLVQRVTTLVSLYLIGCVTRIGHTVMWMVQILDSGRL